MYTVFGVNYITVKAGKKKRDMGQPKLSGMRKTCVQWAFSPNPTRWRYI